MSDFKEVYPAISVIIPTLNRPAILQQTIKDLLRQEYPEDRWEILVIDQSDMFNPHLFADFPKVRHLRLERKNLGLARNIGAQEAEGEILIFLDDDVRITKPHFLIAHVRNYKDPAVGAVAGRVLQPYDKPVSKLHPDKVGRITPHLLLVTGNFNWNRRQPVEGVPGGNFSVRRSIFLEVGGFDTNFIGTAHFEESEFSIRVRKAGYKIMFEPDAELRHLRAGIGGEREHASNREQAFYWFFHNYVYLFMKHGKRRFLPIFAGYLLARGAAYILKYRSIKMFTNACLQGIWDGFRYAHRQLSYAQSSAGGSHELF